MAGRNINAVRATVTAATATGYLTVSSATGLYVGAKAWLSLTAGGSQKYVEITEINGTSVGVRFVPNKWNNDTNGATPNTTTTAPNYGRTDVSAYNAGGYLDQEAQFIYNRNDAPLT